MKKEKQELNVFEKDALVFLRDGIHLAGGSGSDEVAKDIDEFLKPVKDMIPRQRREE